MIKKKLLCFSLILTLASCLVACGDKEEKKPAETTTESTQESTTPEVETTTEEDTTSAEEETSTEEETTSAEEETTTEEVTTEVPTTEAPTQKPTEAPTQKPTEAPTQKPTEQPTTQESTELDKQFQLSSKGYDTLEKWTDTLYITKNGDMYGVINNNGQTVIEFKYISIKFGNADRSELAMYDGSSTVVYNTNIKKVVEYKGDLDRYTNGMLMQMEYAFTDEFDPFPEARFTIKNVYTGETLYQDSPYEGPSEIQDFAKISKNYFDASIMVWRQDEESYGNGKVTIVTPTGSKTLDIAVPFSNSNYYTNGAFYAFSVYPKYDYALIDLNNNKEYDMNTTFKDYQRYYYGYGIAYAVSTDGINYTIYNGTKALTSNTYTWLDFNKTCIIAGNDTSSYIIDYNGNILKTFTDIDVYEYNNKRLVYDGTGVYYIDNNYNKVSDYIVTGSEITVSGGTIKINGLHYFIK